VIVLDATVLIGHLNPQDAHHTRATELLAGFDVDEELGASVVTLAEAMVGPARAGEEYLTLARQAIRQLGIAEIGWGDDAAVRLATLRATTRLKMPDCCVLAAAEQWGGPIASFDAALATAACASGMTVLS
jgi:predicted nucleic acid-binding protein